MHLQRERSGGVGAFDLEAGVHQASGALVCTRGAVRFSRGSCRAGIRSRTPEAGGNGTRPFFG
jgi:hypothetical protein